MHLVKQDLELWSQSRIADELGIDRRTVKKYLGDTAPDGKIRGSNAWHLRTFIVPLYAAVTTKTPVDTSDPDEMAPKDRKDWYQSENERIKLEKEQSLLIPADEVAKEYAALAKPIVQALDSLPDVLERDLNLDGKTVNAIQGVIDSQREFIYEKLNG